MDSPLRGNSATKNNIALRRPAGDYGKAPCPLLLQALSGCTILNSRNSDEVDQAISLERSDWWMIKKAKNTCSDLKEVGKALQTVF